MVQKPAGKILTVVSELAEARQAATRGPGILLALVLVFCGLPFATPASTG